MQIIEKFAARAKDNWNEPGVTIAFLGDSVTQGCFGSAKTGDPGPFFDKEYAYHADFARIMNKLYPSVPVNIINAGVSGGNILHGLERLDRDVIAHKPDLTVICFGLNDCSWGKERLQEYTSALGQIVEKLQAAGSEVIFMTPNMMCTGLSDLLMIEDLRAKIDSFCKRETEGILAMYVEAAKEICHAYKVPVCDCYAKWRRMYECGVDITELLSNKINHPARDMHWLFAVSLVETIFNTI